MQAECRLRVNGGRTAPPPGPAAIEGTADVNWERGCWPRRGRLSGVKRADPGDSAYRCLRPDVEFQMAADKTINMATMNVYRRDECDVHLTNGGIDVPAI